MVMRCAVEGCQSNSAVDKVGYFSVPSIITRQDDEAREISTRRRSLWIARLGEDVDETKVNSNTRVCGKHFVCGRPARLREQQSKDWLPTIGVLIKGDEQCLADSDSDGDVSVKDEPSSPLHCDVDIQMEDEHFYKCEAEEYMLEAHEYSLIVDKCCQADILSENVIGREYFDQVVADNVTLRVENNRLKAKLCEFSEEELNSDDLKVEFYTGLPTFSTLKHVFEFVCADLKYPTISSLSMFQEFMVVLVWLKLKLDEKDLAYRFGVSPGVLGAIINKWLRLISTSLRKCIHWHDREILCNTMPDCFKAAFGNKLVVIVDCFDIAIETPSSFLKTMTTQNDHHKNAKVLIVILPQGTVSFLSKSWVSQVSHREMIEKCKIFDKLLPGDIAISNSKCPINDCVGMHKTKLGIPAFSKEQTLLPSEESQAKREKANILSHIDRVGDILKSKFKILQTSVPVNYLKPQGTDLDCWMDHILTICCALINLSHSESEGYVYSPDKSAQPQARIYMGDLNDWETTHIRAHVFYMGSVGLRSLLFAEHRETCFLESVTDRFTIVGTILKAYPQNIRSGCVFVDLSGAVDELAEA